MSFNADAYISDLQQTVTAAGLNYEVWWTYKNEDNRPEFVDAMNGYTVFFQTSIHAHFVALLVALYRLYETPEKTSYGSSTTSTGCAVADTATLFFTAPRT